MGHRFFEAGEFELQIGSASDDIHMKKTIIVGNYSKKDKQTSDFVRVEKLTGKQIHVSGLVCDVQATPLANVAVYSANTGKRLAITNAQGVYQVKVQTDDTLLFQSKGFKSTYVEVNKKRSINVKLSK